MQRAVGRSTVLLDVCLFLLWGAAARSAVVVPGAFVDMRIGGSVPRALEQAD